MTKYSKADIQKQTGVPYAKIQQCILLAWTSLPIVSNMSDSRKIYTDETVVFLQENYPDLMKRK